MMKFVVSQPSLPILSKVSRGSQRFPVNRIYCVGRNYREHAIEMGHDPDREPPFFFQKPSDAVVDTSACVTSSTAKEDGRCVIPYPPMTKSLHHEAELVVCIGKEGLRIPKETAMNHVFGYALGCDLTRRDLQAEAKKMSRPWASAKGFDCSAPCGPVLPKEALHDVHSSQAVLDGAMEISLQVNGEERQRSTLDHMIWNVPEIVSYLSQYYRLKPGDLVMTGTPAGVQSLDVGDFVVISCGTLPPCEFYIGDPES